MAKTIVIIGAGPGVGLATAERFGAEGFNVSLIARNKEKLAELKAKLNSKGISAAFFQADILDRNALVEALKQSKEHFGRIDVIEFSPSPSMGEMHLPRAINVDNLQLHLDQQLFSAIAAVQTVLPDMLQRKEGSLLFTAAVSAQKPFLITASYAVAAGALLNYVRLLNKDLAPENIFSGIVSIAATVYNDEQPDPELLKHFPPGIPLISSKEIAEVFWQMHATRKEHEVIVGDLEKLLNLPGLS